MKGDIQKAREIIDESKTIVAFSGAGMSAECGVPTFRGKDGLWKNHSAQDLATPDAFKRDPRTVWQWYDWRRSLIKPLEPNLGHYAIAGAQERKDISVITQNVDGLHRKAGSQDVSELHGNIWRVRCTECGMEKDNTDVPIDILPKCDECSGLLRPAIVWFGEPLDPSVVSRSSELLSKADVTIVVGTSGIVQPAASMAAYAKESGSKIIEVNIEETPGYGIADVFILGKAGEVLPQILEEDAL